jgi:hypothetical protein
LALTFNPLFIGQAAGFPAAREKIQAVASYQLPVASFANHWQLATNNWQLLPATGN